MYRFEQVANFKTFHRFSLRFPYLFDCLIKRSFNFFSIPSLSLSIPHSQHYSVLHYRINKLPNGDVVLQGLPNQSFASPMELIDTVDGLACKPTKPLKSLYGKCLPPTHWGLQEELIRDHLLSRAPDFGLTGEQLAEQLDCDLHFSETLPPIVRSLILKSLHEVQPWYHYRLSRADAERRLEAAGHLDGKFL